MTQRFSLPPPAAIANEMRLLLEYGPTCGYFAQLEKSILIDAPPADLEGVTPRSNQRSRRVVSFRDLARVAIHYLQAALARLTRFL